METQKRHLLKRFLDGQCSSLEELQVDRLLGTEEGRSFFRGYMLELDLEAGLYKMKGINEKDLDSRVLQWKSKLNEAINPKKDQIVRTQLIGFLKKIRRWTQSLMRKFAAR